MPRGVYKHNPNQLLKKGHKLNVGRKLSEDHKINIGNSLRGKKKKPFSEETKRKMSISHKGKPRFDQREEKSIHWKGDKVSCRALHFWVQRILGKPTKCEHCGKDNLVNIKGVFVIHWANKDHKYRRVKEDWIRLCVKCHGVYDKINNLRKHDVKI